MPLIHGPAEDAIEAQSAAVGPNGREACRGADQLSVSVGKNGGNDREVGEVGEVIKVGETSG